MKTGVLKISDWAGYVPHFEAIWTSTWAEVGPSWGQAASSSSQVGPKLEPSGLAGPDLAAMSDRNGAFGRCCADMQNVQIQGTDFWRPDLFRANMAPPAEGAPVNRGLFESMGSAPKLSRLGTFGTGGFSCHLFRWSGEFQ